MCGEGKEDALHLWVECSVTRGFGEAPATGPINWSPNQLCRFLRESLIAELLDRVRIEHPGGGSTFKQVMGPVVLY